MVKVHEAGPHGIKSNEAKPNNPASNSPSKSKDNLPQPSPDTRGLDVIQPDNVDEQAAETNRDVRQLAKKSHRQQTRNSPENRRNKDL